MEAIIETHFDMEVPDYLMINGLKVEGKLEYGDFDGYESYFINENIEVDEDMEYIVYTYFDEDNDSDVFTILIETFATPSGEMDIWLYRDGNRLDYQCFHFDNVYTILDKYVKKIEKLVKQ